MKFYITTYDTGPIAEHCNVWCYRTGQVDLFTMAVHRGSCTLRNLRQDLPTSDNLIMTTLCYEI